MGPGQIAIYTFGHTYFYYINLTDSSSSYGEYHDLRDADRSFFITHP
jgi:hypothetical protein